MHDTDPPPHNQPSPKDLFQAGYSVSGLSRDGWTACFDASGLSRRPSCGAWLPHSPHSVEKMRLRWAARASPRHRAVAVEVEPWPPSRSLMDFRRHRQTHSWAPNKLIRAPQICSSPFEKATHPPPRSCLQKTFSALPGEDGQVKQTTKKGINSNMS